MHLRLKSPRQLRWPRFSLIILPRLPLLWTLLFLAGADAVADVGYPHLSLLPRHHQHRYRRHLLRHQTNHHRPSMGSLWSACVGALILW